MFKIEDGREHFYQWDIDRRIIVDNPAIGEVHFSNIFSTEALVVNTYQENGITLVNVPNILLQKDWPIDVYTYSKDFTNCKAKFEVESRNKPSDYVYTETEVLDFEALEKQIEELSEELKNIELTPGEKGEPGEPGKDGYTPVKGVDYFDGEQGIPGEPGKDGVDGYTPVKGTDYWTAADKQEIIDEVSASIGGSGGKQLVIYKLGQIITEADLVILNDIKSICDTFPKTSEGIKKASSTVLNKYDIYYEGYPVSYVRYQSTMNRIDFNIISEYITTAVAPLTIGNPIGEGGSSKILTAINYSDYISGGGGGWTLTSDKDNYSIFNAKEIFISLYDYDSSRVYTSHQLFPEGYTLGNNYSYENFYFNSISSDYTTPYWYWTGYGIEINNVSNWSIRVIGYKE